MNLPLSAQALLTALTFFGGVPAVNSLNKFKKHITSVLPLSLMVSMPLFSAIKRQPSEGNR